MSKSHTRGEAPYYDGFDESKDYSSVLFRPGFVVQTQELNEMQSILKQNIRNISGALLSNGDIIEGCQCVITDASESTNSTAKTCVVTAGRIYINGDIYSISETTLTLKGAGSETVGVKLFDEVITEDDDPDLLDSSAGYANAQMSGAHRQKTYAKIVVSDPNASVLYNVFDGALVTSNQTEESTENAILGKLNATLARRTYDESGNYRVDGLQLSAKGESDDNNIMLTISAGKAYIRGVELSRAVATTMKLERATDLRLVDTEIHDYSEGVVNYDLNNAPVIRDGLSMKAYVQTTTSMTKGLRMGSDGFSKEFTQSSVASLVRVWDTTHGDYTIGYNSDCHLLGNSIKWNGNSEPDSGATYNVTFTYVRTMEYGVDFTLVNTNGVYSIKLINQKADDGQVKDKTNAVKVNKPVNGKGMMFDYKFMLYRRDLIYMDYLGNIQRIKGQSDVLPSVATPIDSNENDMVLGSVLLTPMSDNLTIINNTNRRLSMNELQRIAERLSNVEESLAMTDLDNEAMEGEDATSLVGIYTDGFIGVSKCDMTHSEFDCAIDVDNEELTLSSKETLHPLSVVKRNDLQPISSYKQYNSLVTSSPTETKLLSVDSATNVKIINQYAVFTGMPTITITPRQNNWIDEQNITVQGSTVTQTVTLRRWWYHGSESWVESEKAQYIALGFTDGGASAGWANLSRTTSTSTTTVLSTAIKYMQQITITVVGQMFDPYTDNIVVTFNGNKMSMTPAATAYNGTMTGTLKANVDGYTCGTFVVPANTLCGTVEVQIYPYGDTKRIASTTYTSTGILRTITTTVWPVVTRVNTTDPLAQTFQFDDNQFLTSIGLYFCKKDNHDVSVQIRGCDNGYPNQKCYAEKILKASEIKTSTHGTVETKVTFDDPVFCEKDTQYAICILSESTVTSMFYSELGGTDIVTNVQLLKNPYIAGMMFSSSNAIAWTAHQGDNLKFSIYGNRYNSDGYVYFNEINNVTYDRIMLMADVSTPDGTELTWEYSNDSGRTWLPITLFYDIELSEIITKIMLRAKMKNWNTVSPAILASSCYLIGFYNNTECNYVSRNIVLDDNFTHVKQSIAVYDPDNTHTNVHIYYATDVDGVDWKHAQASGTAKNLGANWYRYTYEDDIGGLGAKNFRVKIKLTTNLPTVRPRVASLMNILT